MPLESVTVSTAWLWLMGAAAAIVALSNAWKILAKYLHPEADLREKIEKHEEMLENDNRRLKQLEKQLAADEEFDGVMSIVMFAMLNHMLSGNDVDKLKSARDELQKYMARRK